MNYEKLIEALKLDLPKALENCPKCGGCILVTIGIFEKPMNDKRPFSYFIRRECSRCCFEEEL